VKLEVAGSGEPQGTASLIWKLTGSLTKFTNLWQSHRGLKSQFQQSHEIASPVLERCWFPRKFQKKSWSQDKLIIIWDLLHKYNFHLWLLHAYTSQSLVAQFVEALRCKPEGRVLDSLWCHFAVTQSFWPHYGPGVESVSNINEYQEYFLGGKGGRYVGMTTLPNSCVNCLVI
jgi:hypothetical protein